MSNIKEQFCSYEISLKLKELGFKEECLATIDQTEYIHINSTKYLTRGAMYYNEIPVPLWQQAIDWFREKHNIWISINVEILTLKHSWEIFRPLHDEFEVISYKDNSDEWDLSYEGAREQAILKAIELCKTYQK